jgi:hypothetical protein
VTRKKTPKQRAARQTKNTDGELKPVTFTHVCNVWASADHWPLLDAVNLALGFEPELVRTKRLTPQQKRGRDVIVELARNCVGDSLTVLRPDAAPGELRVRPAEFVRWFKERTPQPVPPELLDAMNKAAERFRKADPAHELTLMQRRRERCRAIAALLWAQNPELTKAQVAQSEEIRTLGCLGGEYASATIEDWIKEENPTRQGGRPRKSA